MGEQAPPSGPDLANGIPESDVTEGVPLLGHVGDDAIVLHFGAREGLGSEVEP